MKNTLVVLKSEILRDIDKLERLFGKLHSSYQKYKSQKEYAFLVESAFYVNQIYTGFERIFQNAAASFENSIDSKPWHKSLLDRMALGIENIRPPLISGESHRYLNELRAFRHFFRHTYDFDLEDEKFAIVASRAQKLSKTYKADLQQFLDFIDKLIQD